MTKCQQCGHQNRSGTLLCSECGFDLSSSLMGTKLLSEDNLPTRWADLWAPCTDEVKDPTALQIVVLESGRQEELPVIPEICLGRADTKSGVFPDLDLTPDDALEKGVSRTHAKIHFKSNCFFIEDMGSKNGTFVNGQRLTPYLPYPLRQGDRVQLGKLELLVKLN